MLDNQIFRYAKTLVLQPKIYLFARTCFEKVETAHRPPFTTANRGTGFATGCAGESGRRAFGA